MDTGSSDLARVLSRLARAGRRSHKPRDDRNPSDDSDLEPGDYFNLGAALSRSREPDGAYASLSASWFGDLLRLQRLHKARGARVDPRIPFVASTGAELWTPSWVGLGLPRSARKALISSRERSLDSLSKLLANVLSLIHI